MSTKTRTIFNYTKVFASVALVSLLWSCGGGNTEQTDEESTESTTTTEQPAAAADNGEGVGRFKNITLGPVDQAMAAKGKEVFEAKCTACHRATSERVVGPGLLGVTTKQKPAWILNMITNPEEMTKKDPTAKALLAEYMTQMTFQDVSDEQAKQILEYFRANDAGAAEAQK